MATTVTTTLQDVLRELHLQRQHKVAVDAALKEKKALFDAENADLIRQQKDAVAAIVAAEDTARQLAEAHYATTREKAPAPGITIKLFKTISYDAERAFAWAKETKQCLVPEQLDVKKFEKVAPVLSLDFVEYGEEPKATIATDLAKHLPEPEAAAVAAKPPAAADEDPFA